MKTIKLALNGPIPYRTSSGGFRTVNGEGFRLRDITEAEGYKLLGDAIEHHYLMGRAIEQLRKALKKE